MKNLKKLIQKKQINSSNFMQSIPLFSILFIILVGISLQNPLQANTEEEDQLKQRAVILPPTGEDYSLLLKTINSAMAAIRVQDYQKAYFVYSSKEFKRVTPLQAFAAYIKSNPVLLNNKSLSLVEIYISQGIGYYKGVITSVDGVSRTINFQLKLENGEWKILGTQITP